MDSLTNEFLDETHCFWAMCPHPCCWEAEQRVAKGIPRHTVRAPARDLPPAEDGFPTLNVVNVSEWSEGQKPPKTKLLYKTFSSESHPSDGSLSSHSCHALSHLKEHSGRLENVDLHFPGFNSAYQSPRTSDNKQSKGVKLSTAQLSPLVSCSGSSCATDSLILWITNPHHVPQCLSQDRPPRVAVKELICIPSSDMCNSPKANEKKTKAMNKRVQFQLACTQTTLQPRSQRGSSSPGQHPMLAADPDTDATPQGEGAKTAAPSARASPRPPTAPRGASPFLLRNKPVVYHSVSERRLRKAPKDVPASTFRLDSKTGEETVDWQDLRRQAYLWKRYNQRGTIPNVHDRDKPVPQEDARAPQPEQRWDGVSFYPINKATLHHHPNSQMSIGPAVWQCLDCMAGTCLYHQPIPVVPQAECLHSVTVAPASLPKFGSSCQNPLHRLFDGELQSYSESSSKGMIPPHNSLLYTQESLPQKHFEDERESTDCELNQCIPVDSKARPSRRPITPQPEEWTGRNSGDKDPRLSGYQPSPPPPSPSSP